MVTFCQLVRPALRALMGAVEPDPPLLLRATCATRLRKSPGRLEFQRGVLERQESGAYAVRSTGHQGAGVLRSMSEANCFIVLPLEQGDVEPGTKSKWQPFAGWCEPAPHDRGRVGMSYAHGPGRANSCRSPSRS